MFIFQNFQIQKNAQVIRHPHIHPQIRAHIRRRLLFYPQIRLETGTSLQTAADRKKRDMELIFSLKYSKIIFLRCSKAFSATGFLKKMLGTFFVAIFAKKSIFCENLKLCQRVGAREKMLEIQFFRRKFALKKYQDVHSPDFLFFDFLLRFRPIYVIIFTQKSPVVCICQELGG